MKNKLAFNLIILFFLAATQALIIFLPNYTYNAYFMIIRPAAYVIMFALTSLALGLNFGFAKNKKVALTVILLGIVLYIGFMFAAGVFNGFGNNPMTPSLAVVLKNLWRYLPFVVLGEVIRWQIMHSTPKKHKTLMMWLVVLVFTFAMMDDVHRLFSSSDYFKADYLLTTFLPLLVINFFLTYICTSDSLLGVLLFRCTYSLVPIFAPVLPNITQLFMALIVFSVVFIMFIIYDKHMYEDKHKQFRKAKPYKWGRFIVPGLILVSCLGFGFGLFPVTPLAVASNSMQGTFNRGDMVIVQKLDAGKVAGTVKLDDVIQFNLAGRPTVHRVIAIMTDVGGAVTGYVTKGDNNPSPDTFPVAPEMVVGIVKFSIPILGFPSVLLSELSK